MHFLGCFLDEVDCGFTVDIHVTRVDKLIWSNKTLLEDNRLLIIIIIIRIIIIIICLSVFSRTPLMGPRLTLRSVSPSDCLEEVIELATLNPLCYPNSYVSELQPEAAGPDFH